MQEKDMFLKKNKLLIIFIFFFTIFLTKNSFSYNEEQKGIIEYLNKLQNFSVFFIQSDGLDISEGQISIGKKRVRVDYSSPSKILIILDKNKAMYYNYDLQEDEFFDPKDTSAWFFFEIFNNMMFLQDSIVTNDKNNLILTKNGVNDDQRYTLKIYFENNPLVLRRVDLELDEIFLSLSFFNHDYNAKFDKNAFKLINPSFFN